MPQRGKRKAAPSPTKVQKIVPGTKINTDLVVGDPVGIDNMGLSIAGLDRLTFDGYSLTWHGSSAKSWPAFSGPEDESATEAVKDIGPTPQGLFNVNPADIEELVPTADWGSFRVRLSPYANTVDRMKTCLKVLRTGMYIHGGEEKGTHGCIELNSDSDEAEFFSLLKKYGKPIELEVRYAGARELKYEFKSCPYP